MEGIQVSVEKTGVNNNIAVIKVGGYIDTTTSAELEHALEGLLKNGMNDIIIDLGNVDYISSAGWGIFISEIKGIREKGGDLKLVRMIPDVYEVFELLEFHYILKAFDTIEEAVNDFDRNSSLPRKAPPRPAPKPAPPDNGGVMVKNAPSAMVMDQPAPAKVKASARSVDDSIREIITEQPEAGTFKIKQMLATPRYGMHRLSWFEVRRRLKDLGLDSKQKRLDFLRQRVA